jgi:hypothetical protein
MAVDVKQMIRAIVTQRAATVADIISYAFSSFFVSLRLTAMSVVRAQAVYSSFMAHLACRWHCVRPEYSSDLHRRGKTLTAESVAELLHRPLYTITVGELGTSVQVWFNLGEFVGLETYPFELQSLEDKLKSILDIAAAWDAVLLLDEVPWFQHPLRLTTFSSQADVYLEKRSSAVDVERNGLVCVFLRLLEYYQGVLFLTTNHVRHFDDAIFSRVSVALEVYKVAVTTTFFFAK